MQASPPPTFSLVAHVRVYLKCSWKLLSSYISLVSSVWNFLFSIWVFFRNHSRITGLQEKGESISLTRHYHFQPLQRHLNISQAITAESSLLHIGSSRTWTGNLWSCFRCFTCFNKNFFALFMRVICSNLSTFADIKNRDLLSLWNWHHSTGGAV